MSYGGRDESNVELPLGPSFLQSFQRTKQAAFRREPAYLQLPSRVCRSLPATDSSQRRHLRGSERFSLLSE